MIRILLVDDHEVVREGLRKVLETRPGWVVCGEASNGRDAITKARDLEPDVAILDFSMPELNGLEATRIIHNEFPNIEILVLTMHESEQLAMEIMASGARGLVLKSDAGKTLVTAVEHLCQHRSFFSEKVTSLVRNMHAQDLQPTAYQEASQALTQREREVVQLLAEGRSTKEVAGILHISVKTADTHRTNVMRKLELHSVSELVRYAIRNRIIEA